MSSVASGAGQGVAGVVVGMQKGCQVGMSQHS
jgi:hypothetical protein